ncbi:MAG: glycoside hydrolase family 97 catalytic domain-containing protein, partial [Fimbriimonadaceae bacterium]|nr:glycoside hydrolase family 97 catalytic domain-containing protein [Chitinophagales bacterium]
MKNILLLIMLGGLHNLYAQTIQSPDKNLSLNFSLSNIGAPVYELSYKNKPVIKLSKMGIALKDQSSFIEGFEIVKIDTTTFDETWQPVWGEVKNIRNNYRELKVTLTQPGLAERTLIITFRLFNDGLGFRYEFPVQNNLRNFIVKDEITEFHLTGDHKTFWIPGDYDTNEYTYSESKLSKINADTANTYTEIAARTPIGKNYIQSPVMLKTADGLYINIFEAALINYPAMQLQVNQNNFKLTAHLVPDAVGNKAYMQTPSHTPWRTILVSDDARNILSSKMILNLNEPSKIENTSWIKPMKMIGVWWEMHIGTGTWNYSNTNNIDLATTEWNTLTPNGKHGANTANVKRYIDFAAANDIDGVLVEGWNVGWEDWFGNWKENVFDFVTPYPDFNVEELKKYAASKNVKLIMHHETSSSVTNYERRIDEAFQFMKKNNYDAVKTGYVGRIIPRGEYHDGQWMVDHYIRVIEKAAEYEIMVDAHEAVRPTGLHRTYPNWLACEAARGNEFNAWSKGNPPAHETILPFTRLLGGPMDYTPGIFQIKMNYYDSTKTNQVHTTLAKQLALYVTMYSPLQMAADLPENYAKHMDAFQFIKDVPVDWDDTKILSAEPGDYITIARKEKNGNNWFI